jgi:hypothetical protein
VCGKLNKLGKLILIATIYLQKWDSFALKIQLRIIQAEGFQMPGLASATDAEIGDYVMRKLRRIQAEGFQMPGLASATDAEIGEYVMGNLTAVRFDAIDELSDRLIQSLPPTHRLHNFRSDIPAWLAEIDESINKARCNKFERAEHILTNFGIHSQTVFTPYRIQLNKSCAKKRNETMADHIQAKFVHLTLHPLKLEDRIHELCHTNGARSNDSLLAALRARSYLTKDLLLIDRISTWVYWTVYQQQKRENAPPRSPQK